MRHTEAKDLDLIRTRYEGALDESGRVLGLRGVVLIRTRSAEAMLLGAELLHDVSKRLEAAHESRASANNGSLSDRPPDLAAYEQRLADAGCVVERDASLVYVLGEGTRFDSDVQVHRSDGPVPAWFQDANPGNWHPTEWNELLEGHLGPWTMATCDQRIVSICHTPRPMTPRSAEAGVWTRPEYRGRGFAAATTARWVALLRSSGRHLFYTTDSDNRSSQRVAERLGARLLGWTWWLSEAGSEPHDDVHPLCSLRRG